MKRDIIIKFVILKSLSKINLEIIKNKIEDKVVNKIKDKIKRVAFIRILFLIIFFSVSTISFSNKIKNYINDDDRKLVKKIFLYKVEKMPVNNSNDTLSKNNTLSNNPSLADTSIAASMLNKNAVRELISEIELKHINSGDIIENLNEIDKIFDEIKIASVKNKIILIGNEKNIENMSKIKEIIESLDVPKEQIIVKARIIDTSTNLFERLGVNWAINDENGTPERPNLIAKFLSGEVSIGGIFAKGGHFLGIDFNLLKENGDIKIEAMPTLMILENEEGELKVTEEVLVGEKKTTKNNVEYTEPIFSEAGIVFKIQPEIKKIDGQKKIILKIDTEISNFKLTSSYSETSGAKQKNQTKTIIVLDDGSSTFIGGLNQNVGKETVRKIPFFSNIPIIGPLFKYRKTNKELRDIYIEIEAHIKKNEKLSKK